MGRGLAIREKVGHQLGVGESYTRLGKLYLDQGEFELAHDFITRSFTILEKIGLAGLTYSYNNLGLYNLLRGEYSEAVRLFQEALQLSQKLGLAESQVEAYLNLGRLALAEQKPSELVSEWLNRALDFAAGRYPLLVASVHLTQAELLLSQSEPQSALDAVLKGHTIVSEKGLGLLVAWGRRLEGLALEALGQTEQAQAAFELSRAAARTTGQKFELELTERILRQNSPRIASSADLA